MKKKKIINDDNNKVTRIKNTTIVQYTYSIEIHVFRT